MTRRLRTLAGRLLIAAAFLWLAALGPAFAAALGSAPEGIRSVDVLADMRLQLDALAPLAPSRDLAAALWRAYSVPNLSPSRALAAAILLGALAKPRALPALAPALAEVSAAQTAGKTQGQKVAARLSAVAEKYRGDPQSLRALRVLTAPLRRTLSRRAARRGVPDGLKPLWNAVFDGTAPQPPPSAATISPARAPPAALSLRRAARRGAGTRNFGHRPGLGGVRPIERISGVRPGRLSRVLEKTSAIRSPKPLVLSPRALRRLQPGRAAASGTVSRKKTRQAADKNLAEAALLVNRRVAQGRDLDAAMLLQLNRVVRQGIFSYKNAARPGKFRTLGRQRVGHWGARAWFEYAKPRQVLSYLADFLVWYEANEGRLNPVVLAAESYQQLIRIHPFGDGNGRAARMAMDFILQRNGYPPAVFPGRARAEAVHRPTREVVRNVALGVLAAAKKIKP